MNRTLTLAMLAILLWFGAAFAQGSGTNASTNPPAVSAGYADAAASPAPGAGKNGFTKRQAAKFFRKHGYGHVKNLTKDDQGIWHASAMKNGAAVNATLDSQGNISEQ
jgi:hypothetical protein